MTGGLRYPVEQQPRDERSRCEWVTYLGVAHSLWTT